MLLLLLLLLLLVGVVVVIVGWYCCWWWCCWFQHIVMCKCHTYIKRCAMFNCSMNTLIIERILSNMGSSKTNWRIERTLLIKHPAEQWINIICMCRCCCCVALILLYIFLLLSTRFQHCSETRSHLLFKCSALVLTIMTRPNHINIRLHI